MDVTAAASWVKAATTRRVVHLKKKVECTLKHSMQRQNAVHYGPLCEVPGQKLQQLRLKKRK